MNINRFFYIFAMNGALLGIMVLMSVNVAGQTWTVNSSSNVMYLNPTSGKLGIGTGSPEELLHVSGGVLKIGQWASESCRQSSLLVFGKYYEIKLGEWEAYRRLSLYASGGYNFTGGDVMFNGLNVGIGTTNPQYKLDVNGIIRGTSNMYINGNVGIGTTYPNAKLHVQGNMYASGNVGIGTTAPAYKLDVNGIIRCRELRVETTGADFVFETGYELRSLSELRHFIEKNGHLPGVQSAAEMQEKGVSVSELVTTLLQKIEELTLYTIEQKDEIDQLKEDISKIKNQ